jgi:hypothetical protein
VNREQKKYVYVIHANKVEQGYNRMGTHHSALIPYELRNDKTETNQLSLNSCKFIKDKDYMK